MITCDLINYDLVNNHLNREKISIAERVKFTKSDTNPTAEVYFWESLPNSSENSNLKIDNYCSIATGVKFYMGGSHNYKRVSTYFASSSEKENNSIISNGSIHVKSDVYIGRNAVILSGVNIGVGAIVGANAIVSRDIPDYAIAVGNPAKIVKFRFSESVIERLLNTEWWNLPYEILKKNDNLFFVEELNEENLIKIEEICNLWRTNENKSPND